MISYSSFLTKIVLASAVVSVSLVMSFGSLASVKRFDQWRAPVNMESIPGTSAEFNTPFSDGCPIQSPDGLSFYMATNRPGGRGMLDIWVARRESKHDPWGAPENLGAPVNSEFDDFCPTPTSGRRLFFVSTRPGGFGAGDIYVSRLGENGWEEPRNLGCNINSAGGEASPSLFENEDGHAILYFSSNRSGGFAPDSGPPDSDIYFSLEFGPAQLAPGLNTEFEDSRPNVRHDGLEIVFDSTRTGSLGGPDIWTATRECIEDPWLAPLHLDAPINSEASETRASLSRNGKIMVFGSTRFGSEVGSNGLPSNDIYLTTRRRISPDD